MFTLRLLIEFYVFLVCNHSWLFDLIWLMLHYVSKSLLEDVCWNIFDTEHLFKTLRNLNAMGKICVQKSCFTLKLPC